MVFRRISEAGTISPEPFVLPEVSLRHGVQPRLIDERFDNPVQALIANYDQQLLEQARLCLAGVSRKKLLRDVFVKTVAGCADGTDEQKWIAVMEYLSLAINYPMVNQPVDSDGVIIMDPAVLLYLGEGRCGHTARLVVDMALANGYEARIAILAAHVVAEVQWGGRWRLVDAASNFPVDNFKGEFPEWPSLIDVAKEPWRLDRLPDRAVYRDLNGSRTLAGQVMPVDPGYPGSPRLSSRYFAASLFINRLNMSGVASHGNVIYHYKTAEEKESEGGVFSGWNYFRVESESVPTVPLAFKSETVQIITPTVLQQQAGCAVLTIRFLRAMVAVMDEKCMTPHLVPDDCWYEARVSSQSRGWDYGFCNYRFMPKSGVGDVATARVNPIEVNGMMGVELTITCTGDVFIEVIPHYEPNTAHSPFAWPSNEVRCHILSE